MDDTYLYDLTDEIGIKGPASRNAYARVVVAGDLFPGGRLEDHFVNGNVNALMADIMGEFRRHDLCICDLECPLTTRTKPIVKSGPYLRAHPGCARGIKNAGIDIVSLANNHIMDMGEVGLLSTLDVCREAGVKTVGAGKNHKEAVQPLYVRIKELNIAIFSITENEFSIATHVSAGAGSLDLAENYSQIQLAKKQSDFILVLYHGGNEYYQLPSPGKVKTCHYLADIGANAIVGHHIHVPSGIEIYHGVPIVYSTGNFLFDMPHAKHEGWFYGYLVSLEIQSNMVNNLRIIPYEQCREMLGIRFLKNSERRDFLREITSLSSIIADNDRLYGEWQKFCRSLRVPYLANALSLNRFERRLLNSGIWPFWRSDRKGLSALLNLFTCEAHRDTIITLLREELKQITRGE